MIQIWGICSLQATDPPKEVIIQAIIPQITKQNEQNTFSLIVEDASFYHELLHFIMDEMKVIGFTLAMVVLNTSRTWSP